MRSIELKKKKGPASWCGSQQEQCVLFVCDVHSKSVIFTKQVKKKGNLVAFGQTCQLCTIPRRECHEKYIS